MAKGRGKKETSKVKTASKVKCWEVFECSEKECPAYKSKNLRCWLFSGTHCRQEIQGKFLDKIELCVDCKPFKSNMDTAAMRNTLMALNKQLKEFTQIIKDRDEEMHSISMGLAVGLSESFEALKKIASGDPSVRIPEDSEIELISKLKHFINMTAKDIGDIVDQSHEFAMVLAEHFDILHQVSQGNLNARVTGKSEVELLEALKKITNNMIANISKEIVVRKNTEEKYFDLYENAPDGYQSIGPDGTFLEINNTWLKLLGYERFEVINRMKIQDILTDDSLEIFENFFHELREKGVIDNKDCNFKRKDGTVLPISINSTAIYDEKGNFLKSRGIIRDVSEKRTYENKLERISTEWKETFDSMPYGVMLLNSNFHFIRANKYIAELTGIPITELRDKDCYELLYKPYIPIERLSQTKSEESLTRGTLEFFDPRKNKHFALYSTPIHNERGVVISYVHSLVDITDNKTKEEKVTESRDAFLNMLKDLDFSYKELTEVYRGLIISFVNALDAKSPWTKGHSVRVTSFAIATAKELGLKESEIEPLNTAALLHDIGKIGTYDTVLDKPGRLTDEEFALVKMHPGKGADILTPVRQFEPILSIIRHHHERLDGKGYPDGLKGDKIPLLARIIHVADSFDAMTADRPYRKAPGREFAISELKKCSGLQFDPDAAEAFIRYLDRTPEEEEKEEEDAAT